MSDLNLDRRRFVSFLGIGATLPGTTSMGRWLRAPKPDLATIADRLTRCSREAAFPTAVALLRAGATWQDLLGGTFLAGVREIKPQPVGFQFHAVMMVESAFQLGAAAPPEQRLWPAFFNIDDFKRGQARDKARGDWVLKPRGDRSSLRPGLAEKTLERAMLSRDADRADRAIASLYASKSKGELFEILWPLGGRDFTNIGHKIIYTAHAYRTLARIGWRHGLPVLRSLVLGLLDGDGKDPSIAQCERNRELAPGLRKDWLAGEADPEASVSILRELRTVETSDAAGAIAEASGRGVSAASIWDGFRLFAAEILMHDPNLLTVHPTTATNSMAFAFRAARQDATKRVLMLQGASWLAFYRDYFAKRSNAGRGKPGIEVIDPANGRGTPDGVFETAGKNVGQAAQQVLALESDDVPAFAAKLRTQIFTKGTEHHMYKYAAAVLEDVRGCHPSLVGRLLAAGIGYVPSARAADSTIHDRARTALRGKN